MTIAENTRSKTMIKKQSPRTRCNALTKNGFVCKRKCINELCYQHELIYDLEFLMKYNNSLLTKDLTKDLTKTIKSNTDDIMKEFKTVEKNITLEVVKTKKMGICVVFDFITWMTTIVMMILYIDNEIKRMESNEQLIECY